MEIILGVKTQIVGTAKTLVKQIEIDRAAVPNTVEDAEKLPHAYDQIEQQVDDA